MSYFEPYLDDSGIHLPTYNERLDGLIAGYKQIFGEDVYIEPDTMDYQLLSIVAKCWDDLNSVVIDSYYARNPNFASGSALDMLLPLNGMMRKPATKSSVVLSLTGMANETLPAGMQAMDDENNVWEISDPVTFDDEGKATATAYCTVAGPISAGIGEITIINTPHSKWDTVTNNVSAKIGNAVETDAALRLRRAQNLSKESQNTIDGVRATVTNLPGVTSVNILENVSDSTDANGVGAHSIMVVTYGGNDNEIAESIWRKKSPGCGTSGTTSVNYVDEYGYTSSIHFQKATVNPVTVTITLRTFDDNFDESLLSESIPNSVATYVNSLGIGDDLIMSMLNAVIYNANTTGKPIFSVASIVGNATGIVDETDTMVADAKTIFTCDSTSVTVTTVSTNVYQIEVG